MKALQLSIPPQQVVLKEKRPVYFYLLRSLSKNVCVKKALAKIAHLAIVHWCTYVFSCIVKLLTRKKKSDFSVFDRLVDTKLKIGRF